MHIIGIIFDNPGSIKPSNPRHLLDPDSAYGVQGGYCEGKYTCLTYFGHIQNSQDKLGQNKFLSRSHQKAQASD